MSEFTLILGNKAYSSWSLRGWLLLKRSGAAFEEVVVPLFRPGYKANTKERYPEAGLWPEDSRARAVARAITAEMHGGFATLRERLPMDLKRKPRAPGEIDASTGALGAEIARIAEIWTECRERSPSGGPFLFGEFGAADAFYAPVATRLHSYGVALDGVAAAYRDALLSWPDLVAWTEAAQAEPWVMETG